MSKNSAGGGISFCGMLTILFIGLKLGHQINWSWIWVLSPLWFGAAVVLSVIALVMGFALFVVALDALFG